MERWTKMRASILSITIAFLLSGTQSGFGLDISRHENDSKALNAILLRGDIVGGDANKLAAYIASLPPKKNIAVYLDSPGGALYEAMMLGALFHSARIKTSIEGGGAKCLTRIMHHDDFFACLAIRHELTFRPAGSV